MADDVLELTRKCAEALGISTYWNNTVEMWWCKDKNFPVDGRPYDPASDPAQAFELLCWLQNHGRITITKWHFWFGIPAKIDLEYDAQDPAELRLAIMRAVVKVKESQDGR